MPTNRIHDLQNLASEVGGVLSEYIAVHDKMFTEAASLKSVFKNLLGRGTPMSELQADAEALIPRVQRVKARVASFRREAAMALPPAARAYSELLNRYVEALASTVDALAARQRLLSEGSRGGRGNPMTWDGFKAAEQAYEQAVKNYQIIGAQLNDWSCPATWCNWRQ
jgi:hypothetical protein